MWQVHASQKPKVGFSVLKLKLQVVLSYQFCFIAVANFWKSLCRPGWSQTCGNLFPSEYLNYRCEPLCLTSVDVCVYNRGQHGLYSCHFMRQGHSVNLKLTDSARLSSKASGSLLSAFPVLELQVCTITGIITWVLDIILWSSNQHGQPSPNT